MTKCSQPQAHPDRCGCDRITVSKEALRRVLHALVSNPHEIRELQATMHPASIFPDNPINQLISDFNRQPQEP